VNNSARMICGLLAALSAATAALSMVWLVSYWQGGYDQIVKVTLGWAAALVGWGCCLALLTIRWVCVWRGLHWPQRVIAPGVWVLLMCAAVPIAAWSYEWASR
jgi:hypothetical protein